MRYACRCSVSFPGLADAWCPVNLAPSLNRGIFKVAAHSCLRSSARVAQEASSCLHRGSLCTIRGASRRYGTVTTADQHKAGEPPPSNKPAGSLDRPRSPSRQSEPLVSRPRPTPQYYVPSVLLPREAAHSPTVHKIHILGEDERSKFIAHALSSVYDSVEMLAWKNKPSSKYQNIQKSRKNSRHGPPTIETNLTVPQAFSKAGDSHIDQLIVTGQGHEAAEALDLVKDRIDEDTTVCLMNDGLGVLEHVRKRIFQGTDDAAPSFLLGHMSHRLVFNRTYDAVTQLKQGQIKLTFAQAPRMRVKDMQKIESRPHLVKSMAQVKDLHSSLDSYDQWLRFKLPSVLFASVVEPVCVLLEMPYRGLLQNPAAQRIMQSLMSEILAVLDNMPELQQSAIIRDYVHSKGIRRFVHNAIAAKKSQPSQLVRRIENGLPTDVDFSTGYFLRRGQRLGMSLPMTTMMRDMVKARHSQAIERLNSYVPIEETSVPSHLAFRYRTLPR